MPLEVNSSPNNSDGAGTATPTPSNGTNKQRSYLSILVDALAVGGFTFVSLLPDSLDSIANLKSTVYIALKPALLAFFTLVVTERRLKNGNGKK